MACWLRMKINGISGSTIHHLFLIREITLTTDSILTSNSNSDSLFYWSQSVRQTPSKWTSSREPGCQTTRAFQKIETSMVSWAGFQILTSSAPKTTTKGIKLIESILMAPWTTMSPSIIPRWPTQNSLGRMLLPSRSPGRGCRPWASTTDRSLGLPCDQPRVPSKLHCTQLPSYSIGMFQTSIGSTTKLRRLNNLRTPFHSLDLLTLSGSKLSGPLDLEVWSLTRRTDLSKMLPIKHSLMASMPKLRSAKPHRRSAWGNKEEKTDGTPTLSPYQSITRRCTAQWRFLSIEFDSR